MFNLLSPEEQRNLLTFALNPEDYIQKTVGIDPLVYDGILNKTADGVISPYKIIHDETWSELYILVNGTQKDVRKEASDWVETLKTIAKLANLSKVDLKEVGNQSMEAYTNAVQSSVTSTLKVNGVI